MSKPIKICQVASGSSITDLRGMLEPYGNYEISYDCDQTTDFVLGWSVTMMYHTENIAKRFPKATLINYQWDIYGWVWTNPREDEYDYKRYGELLKRSAEVWCPSECTVKRTHEWFGPNVPCVTIKTAIPTYDSSNIRDEGYVLNSLRRLPDKNLDLFEKACTELGLPFMSTDHQYELDKFIDIMAGCRFNCVPYHENSTGGLALIQTYYLGKPTLISNSPYQGGNEYIGDRAIQFQWDNYEDLKRKLVQTYENPPKVDIEEARRWINKKYSKLAMGKQMHERLKVLRPELYED